MREIKFTLGNFGTIFVITFLLGVGYLIGMATSSSSVCPPTTTQDKSWFFYPDRIEKYEIQE